MLADLVRTDRHNHRRVAGDSSEVEGTRVLARTHQNLIWARVRHTNQLRNALREYYPAALETFADLADRDAVTVLGRTPDPKIGARLSLPQIRAALKAGGRQRYLDKRAQQIQRGLRTPQLTAPQAVVAAYATAVEALVGIIGETNRRISELEATLTTRFEQHPDAGDLPLPTRTRQRAQRPGARRVRGRPPTLHQRQVPQELRRDVAHHHRIRKETQRRGTSRTQPASPQRHRPMGVLFDLQQCRRPSVLRPASSSRRPPPPSPPSPRQPPRRNTPTAASNTKPPTTSTPPGPIDNPPASSQLDIYTPGVVSLRSASSTYAPGTPSSAGLARNAAAGACHDAISQTDHSESRPLCSDRGGSCVGLAAVRDTQGRRHP